MDFPNSPVQGTTYIQGVNTWIYDGSKWNIKPTTIQGISGIQGIQGNTGPQGQGAITWTQRASLSGTVSRIAYNGSNLYVAVGSCGVYTSPDGITWTYRDAGFGGNTIYAVAFGNGLWVAVGVNGTITTSSDGITWTARTANVSTFTLYDVTYANGTWVAVGAGANGSAGGITTSIDGTTWTQRETPNSTNATLLATIAYGNGYWVAGGWQSEAGGNIYYSTDATSWTAGDFYGAPGSNYGISNIYYSNSQWWAFALHKSSNNVEYIVTTDASPPTTATFSFTNQNISPIVGNTNSNPFFNICGLHALYNNNFYIAGNFSGALSGPADMVKFSNSWSGSSPTSLLPYTTLPAVYAWSNSNGIVSRNSRVNAIYVGSAGTILGGGWDGEIWTSF